MSREPRAWVLNLDAEHELEARGRYQPTRHMLEIVARQRARLVGSLVGPGDVVLGLDDPERARGLPGVAWSPTPRALAELSAAGALPPPAPGVDVLRAVNARPFAAAVREPLQRASFEKRVATTLECALAQLSRPAPLGWLVRRTFGAAGRGRRRIAAGRPAEAELAWLEASLRLGPLVLEPWVEVTREHTRSAFVDEQGRVTISAPCFQETTREGAWTGTELARNGELAREDDAELEAAVDAAGAALSRAGYFGPFGIDAYRHRALDGSGRTVLNPLSEINARFTMDWTLAMGR
jgi:hypothetical protein